jgi:imidazolonepropionase
MATMNAPLPVDLLIEHAAELLTCAPDAADLVGRIPDGAVACAGERIVAVGPTDAVRRLVDARAATVVDATGQLVMPGFVDSHTHVVFGGSRVEEYTARLTGADLSALAARGVAVGIGGTVALTRLMSVDDLAEATLPRLREMLAAGTTTVESKSGYGLSTDAELKMLQVNRQLAGAQPVELVSTFLGAHASPPDVPRERYLDEIITEMLPAVAQAGLAEYCDAFCEQGYFTIDETRAVLEAGLAHGLKPKLHLDQYAPSGAAQLAAELGATSVDHLNFTPPEDLLRLAAAGVVGVAMPAIDFAVAHPRPIDVRALLDAGLTVALATDICPGCWLPSMQFLINLACRLHGISPAEALRASTLSGALALDRGHELGSLEVGKLADVLIMNVARHEDLAYRLGRNAVELVVKRGRIVVERRDA